MFSLVLHCDAITIVLHVLAGTNLYWFMYYCTFYDYYYCYYCYYYYYCYYCYYYYYCYYCYYYYYCYYWLLFYFNSRFLPDQENATSKHTSPKHNAYPTWTKEFIFAGIDKYDLIHGGIELLLYDHHKFFSNSLIGGVRLTHPQRIFRDPCHRFSTGGIQRPMPRDCSPVCTPRPSSISKTSLNFLDISKFTLSCLNC